MSGGGTALGAATSREDQHTRAGVVRRARAAVVLAVCLAFALAGAAIHGSAFRGSLVPALLGALGAGALGAGLAYASLRAPRPLVRWCSWTPIALALFVPLDAALCWVGAGWSEPLRAWQIVSFGIAGALGGGVAALVGSPLLAFAERRVSHGRSLATPPVVRLASATWTALVTAPVAIHADDVPVPVRACAALLATASACAACAAAWYMVSRARWLSRVRRGEVPGYRIVPTSSIDLPGDPDVLPRFSEASEDDAVLVRDVREGAGAYRASVRPDPIAYAGMPRPPDA